MNTLMLILMLAAILYFMILPTLKTGAFKVKKLIVTPLVFAYLNYDSIEKHFDLHAFGYFILALGLILGVAIGAFCRKNSAIRSDQQNELIEVTGSYFSLIMFFIIFAVHFIIGYVDAVYPGYLLQPSLYQETLMFLLTLVSCVPMGSNGMLYYKYHTATPTNLL